MNDAEPYTEEEIRLAAGLDALRWKATAIQQYHKAREAWQAYSEIAEAVRPEGARRTLNTGEILQDIAALRAPGPKAANV